MKIVVMRFNQKSFNHENIEFIKDCINNYVVNNTKVIIIVSQINKEYTNVTNLIDGYISEAEKDYLMATTVMISSVIASDKLNKMGIRTRALSIVESGIITDDNFGEANVIFVNDFYLRQALNDYPVLIVPGFLGTTVNHEITTLGADGADLTAVILAAKLNAIIELYVDMNNTIHDKRITFSKLENYFDNGYNFLGRKAMNYAMKKRKCITIRSINSDQVLEVS